MKKEWLFFICIVLFITAGGISQEPAAYRLGDSIPFGTTTFTVTLGTPDGFENDPISGERVIVSLNFDSGSVSLTFGIDANTSKIALIVGDTRLAPKAVIDSYDQKSTWIDRLLHFKGYTSASGLKMKFLFDVPAGASKSPRAFFIKNSSGSSYLIYLTTPK